MATNGSSMASCSSGSSDSAVTLKLTNAALAISIGAFFLSVLQALLAYLQFDNSSVGRRRCSAEVMGQLWASKTEAIFKGREWRYQIFFEVPVFYTARPSITVGPLTRLKPSPKKRWFDRFRSPPPPEPQNKSDATYQDIAIPMEEINIQKHVQPIYKITGSETSHKLTMTRFSNTTEKWANVHTADDEGCSWTYLLDALQGQEKESRQWDTISKSERELGEGHTFCYLIQRKRRCWDFMPLNATKPFATTNICHLIEMMSMLGLVWKEVDLKTSNLTADGNGYMVKSEYAQGLGILARFSRLSNPKHGEDRIIPCDEIKKLCFGEVPSLFDKVKQPLVVSPGRLKSSLKHLLPALSPNNRDIFVEVDRPPRSLMFPVTFELIAMLARPLHIRGSRFRRLPNPCADAWTPGLNMAACLNEFAESIEANAASLGQHGLTSSVRTLFQNGKIDSWTTPNQRTLIRTIKIYFDAVKRLADAQTQKFYPLTETPMLDPRQAELEQATSNYEIALVEMLDSLHEAILEIDLQLEDLLVTSDVRGVVASHFTAVLDQQDALKTYLTNAVGENAKETALVKFYFKNIHAAVATEPAEENRTRTTADSASSTSASTAASDAVTLSPKFSDERSAIWLGLTFRMWAWLFLHDFNPEDRMIERSELKNNRLPVYIS